MENNLKHSIKHCRQSNFGKNGIYYYVCYYDSKYFNQSKFVEREFFKLSDAKSFLAYVRLEYDSNACIVRCCYDKLKF